MGRNCYKELSWTSAILDQAYNNTIIGVGALATYFALPELQISSLVFAVMGSELLVTLLQLTNAYDANSKLSNR